MAPVPSQNVSALEAGYPDAAQEKASLIQGTESQTLSHQQKLMRPVDQARMASIRKMSLAMLMCLLVSFGLTTAMMPVHRRGEPCHDSNGEAQVPEAAGDHPGFTSLLGSASTDSLHELLHKYFPNRYKHGVWSSEHQAMEAVHRDDAALATSIVQLAKRQDSGNNNTTSTSAPPQDTSTPPPVTETTFVTVTETGGETTTSAIVTVSTPPADTTTSELPPASTSSDLPPTTSEPEVSSTTTSSASTPSSATPTSPGTLTSASSDLATTSSIPPSSSSIFSSNEATSSSRSSSSSSRRDTSTTTSESSSSHSLKMITSTFTSTLSGGEVSIVTQTSIVGGNPAQSDAATSTRPDGSLQTNAAASRQNRVVEAVMGAVLGGAMLL